MKLSARIRLYVSRVLQGEAEGIGAAALRALLAPLSFIYRGALWMRAAGLRLGLIRVRKAPLKVISVGNLTLGGTGKSSLIAHLAAKLSGSRRVAVLSRGYGMDEVRMLRQKIPQVPVLVGKDRAKLAIRAAGELGAAVVLLDDGFQHRKLGRDLEIVTLDGGRPFGTGRLLPWGSLREPLSALARADVFVIVRGDGLRLESDALREKLAALNGRAEVFEACYEPSAVLDIRTGERLAPAFISGRRVGAFAGIAQPCRFYELLQKLGAQIVWTADFPDHHAFERGDIAFLDEKAARQGTAELVTTEKDRVKLEPLLAREGDKDGDSPLRGQSPQALRFLSLEVSLVIEDEERLFDRLAAVLAR